MGRGWVDLFPCFFFVGFFLSKVVEHSLEAIISRHDGTAIVKDVRGEIDALVKRLYPDADGSGGKSRRRLRPGDRRSAREEVGV